MILRYVRLTFDSALLFRGGKKDKTYLHPITYFQMYNILSALTNNKLVNSRSESVFSHDDDIVLWAKECLIKYSEQPKYDIYKTGFETPIKHLKVTNKSVGNSNTKVSRLTWFEFMYFFGVKNKNDLAIEEILSVLESEFGITPKSHSYEDAIVNVFSSPNWFKFIEICEKHTDKIGFFATVIGFAKRKGLISGNVAKYDPSNPTLHFGKPIKYRGGGYELKISGNSINMHFITSGIEEYERYDGEILIPIRDDAMSLVNTYQESNDYKALVNGPEVCSVLDGGVGLITDVVRPREVNINEYQKIGDVELIEI